MSHLDKLVVAAVEESSRRDSSSTESRFENGLNVLPIAALASASTGMLPLQSSIEEDLIKT